MVSVVQLHPQNSAAALEPLAEGLAGAERALLARALELAAPLYAGPTPSPGAPTRPHALGPRAALAARARPWREPRRHRARRRRARRGSAVRRAEAPGGHRAAARGLRRGDRRARGGGRGAPPAAGRAESAREPLDIYAPLANRLGVWQLKWELEDLSFRFLEPELYKKIAQMLDEKRAERDRYIAGAIAALARELGQP